MIPVRFTVNVERLHAGEVLIHGWCAPYGPTELRSISVVCRGSKITGALRKSTRDANAVEFTVRTPANLGPAQLYVEFASGDERILADVIPPDLPPIPARISSYHDWLLVNEAEGNRTPQTSSLRSPLISILLPTCDTDPYYLDRCLQSVFSQTYPNWELCIADDASAGSGLKQRLIDVARAEPRVRLTFRDQRGNISAASNSALATATGNYICLLDHDDELHPQALMGIASLLSTRSGTRMVYTDEDKIDDLGRRFEPAFKPEFDPHWFRCINYLGHLVSIETALVRSVGGFRSETDGAQDWDLLLRCTEQIDRDAVAHIARPLYHWRAHSNSTALNLDSKPFARQAWRRVLADHIERAHLPATAGPGWFDGSMRLRFRMPLDSQVAVALSAEEDRAAFTRWGADSVRFFPVGETVPDGADVVIYAGEAIASVNPGFIEELGSQALRPEIAAACGVVTDADGTILTSGFHVAPGPEALDLFAGMRFGRSGYRGHALVVRQIPLIGAHCFAVRREFVAGSRFQPDALVETINREAAKRGLDLIITPYAVSSVCEAPGTRPPLPPEYPISLNPNLIQFENYGSIYQRDVL